MTRRGLSYLSFRHWMAARYWSPEVGRFVIEFFAGPFLMPYAGTPSSLHLTEMVGEASNSCPGQLPVSQLSVKRWNSHLGKLGVGSTSGSSTGGRICWFDELCNEAFTVGMRPCQFGVIFH